MLRTLRKVWSWEPRYFGIGRDVHITRFFPHGISKREIGFFLGALLLLFKLNLLGFLAYGGMMGNAMRIMLYLGGAGWAARLAQTLRMAGKGPIAYFRSRASSVVFPTHWHRMQAVPWHTRRWQPGRLHLMAIWRTGRDNGERQTHPPTRD